VKNKKSTVKACKNFQDMGKTTQDEKKIEKNGFWRVNFVFALGEFWKSVNFKKTAPTWSLWYRSIQY
jgi:hypothetical protein